MCMNYSLPTGSLGIDNVFAALEPSRIRVSHGGFRFCSSSKAELKLIASGKL